LNPAWSCGCDRDGLIFYKDRGIHRGPLFSTFSPPLKHSGKFNIVPKNPKNFKIILKNPKKTSKIIPNNSKKLQQISKNIRARTENCNW